MITILGPLLRSNCTLSGSGNKRADVIYSGLRTDDCTAQRRLHHRLYEAVVCKHRSNFLGTSRCQRNAHLTRNIVGVFPTPQKLVRLLRSAQIRCPCDLMVTDDVHHQHTVQSSTIYLDSPNYLAHGKSTPLSPPTPLSGRRHARL